jgi:hypothetical protein
MLLVNELVPKLIDYALKRMVLEQALAVFRPRAYKTAVLREAVPKTEVLEQPQTSLRNDERTWLITRFKMA